MHKQSLEIDVLTADIFGGPISLIWPTREPLMRHHVTL